MKGNQKPRKLTDEQYDAYIAALRGQEEAPKEKGAPPADNKAGNLPEKQHSCNNMP